MAGSGLHKYTIDQDTGNVLLEFGYDENNDLISITDQFNNQITIQRDANGEPTAIVSPDNLATTLSIDGNNHLTRVTYPGGSHYDFEYTPDGLMRTLQGRTKPDACFMRVYVKNRIVFGS